MFKSTRWLWPIVGMLAIVWAGCGSPPATDATDPLPTVFDNKPLDPSKFGPSTGMSMGMGKRRGMGGVLGTEMEVGDYPDPKKGTDPATAPGDSSKQDKKEGSNKEQP